MHSFSSSAPTSDGIIPEPDIRCLGSLENFSSILSPAFRASTVFVGLAVLMSILCLVALLLFCFMKDQSVYEICATIQALQGKMINAFNGLWSLSLPIWPFFLYRAMLSCWDTMFPSRMGQWQCAGNLRQRGQRLCAWPLRHQMGLCHGLHMCHRFFHPLYFGHCAFQQECWTSTPLNCSSTSQRWVK